MKKLIFAILLCAGLHTASFAQDYQVPEYELKTVLDYAKYEQAVLDACNWALANPAAENPETQGAVAQFVVTWVSGTPTIYMDMYPDELFQQLCNREAGYVVLYFQGAAKHLLEGKKEAGTLNSMVTVGRSSEEFAASTYAGLKAILDYYQANKAVMGENKLIEQYLKLEQKGRLKGIVEQRCVAAAAMDAQQQ